jgi:hypothetical protein
MGGLLAGALWLACPTNAAERPGVGECAPSGELSLLCGMEKPEDLAALPGGRWIIASGMSSASGLHLIDGKAKTWERWIAPVATAPRAPFAGCASQPLPDEFQAHGISLRDTGRGRAILYVVNHGGREPVQDLSNGRGHETIEVFDINTNGKKPALSWAGCVPLPGKLVANSVVSRPDGTIFATVLVEPEHSVDEIFARKPTGAVYRWKPGAVAFERLAGTELVGNNGIEVSADGKILYVASFTGITSFTNTNPSKRIANYDTRDAHPDNLHRVNGRLILAGQRTDVCPPAAGSEPCMGGYFVSSVNPDTLALTPIATGGINPGFSGAATGLPVGKTLWLGSYSASSVAYRTLP